MTDFNPNPELDLVLTREVDVPRDLVWAAWTQPEHLKHWFVPRPWTIAECEVDLRPGGTFRTVMCGPEGERHDNTGCYLEVRAPERLVWTDALLPEFRPAGDPGGCGLGCFMTAIVSLEALGPNRMRYTAIALHNDADGRKRHEEMGFMEGWGTCLDQLVAYVKSL